MNDAIRIVYVTTPTPNAEQINILANFPLSIIAILLPCFLASANCTENQIAMNASIGLQRQLSMETQMYVPVEIVSSSYPSSSERVGW